MTLMIPAGRVQLEAVLRDPPGQRLAGAAVLCHPHPVYGGTMDNRVVFRTGKAVMEAGFAALRFNFRGVGASTGSYDNGDGEKDDVRAAIDWLELRYPRTPLALAGFSFGAWVGLQVGCTDPRIRAVTGLGLPLNYYDFDFLADNEKPALYLAGTLDEFCPRAKMERLARRLPPSSKVHLIKGADHFFGRELDQVQELVTRFYRELAFQEV